MTRRTEKISRLMQIKLAEVINYHLSDPRVDTMLTVTGVDLSPDLGQATVRVTALGAEAAQMRTILRALEHARGRIAHMLGERIDMRTVPRLTFRADEQAIRTRQTLAAIDRAMKETPPEERPPSDPPAETSER